MDKKRVCSFQALNCANCFGGVELHLHFDYLLLVHQHDIYLNRGPSTITKASFLRRKKKAKLFEEAVKLLLQNRSKNFPLLSSDC